MTAPTPLPSAAGGAPAPSLHEAARRLVVVTNRRLDTALSGNGAYLKSFLDQARALGWRCALVFAPDTAFGNTPFARLDPGFGEACETVWPWSARLGGGLYVATRPQPWLRAALRAAVTPLRRAGLVEVGSRLSLIPREAEMAAMADAVRALTPDAVVVEYSSLGPLLERLGEAPVRGVLLHDLFASRAAAFRAEGRAPDHADITHEEEAARCRGATLLFHASLNELGAMAPRLPAARHVWLSPRPQQVLETPVPDAAPAAVFFGVNHAGNRDAVDHLLAEVWPAVLALRPDARCLIAGSLCDLYRGRELPDNIELLGRVPDLAALAGPDRIGLAPTRVGSGVSIKVADYMGLGMPVLAYRGGVEGFGAELDEAVEIAADPGDFAERLARLLDDRELRLARSAQSLEAARALMGARPVESALGRGDL